MCSPEARRSPLPCPAVSPAHHPDRAPLPELAPAPRRGRTFTVTRCVRSPEATATGRVRLDAVARYLQDVATDDIRDSGYADPVGWVARRTLLLVRRWACLDELVELTTFAAGLGSRWADRRTSLVGDAGARIEASTIWVHVEADGRRAKPLSPQFHELYGEASGGRHVSARLMHPAPPPGAPGRPWALRTTDLDAMGHVNNAVHWCVLEEDLGGSEPALPLVAELEYRTAIGSVRAVDVVRATVAGERWWWLRTAATVHASARLSA